MHSLSSHPSVVSKADLFRRLYVVSSLVALAACTGNGTTDRPGGQVAAVVNKGEITVHLVNHSLSRVKPLSDESPEASGRRVLESLIDQELFAQTARQQGLDQDPAVIQALHAAQRQVLAGAYLERIASRAAQPGSDAIDAYYESHPELFARRKFYTLQEFLVAGPDALLARVSDISRDAKNPVDFEARLNAAGLSVASRKFAQAAEDMPLQLLKSLSPLEVGHALVVPEAQSTRAFFILDVLIAPVDRRTAIPAIGRVLFAETQRKLLAEQLASLRKDARIDYRGPFAQAAPAPLLAASATGL